jgi:hypothetical protein
MCSILHKESSVNSADSLQDWIHYCTIDILIHRRFDTQIHNINIYLSTRMYMKDIDSNIDFGSETIPPCKFQCMCLLYILLQVDG